MSELKVNSIAGTGASSAAITIDASDGTATGKFTNLPGRNKVINGQFNVWQRATTSGSVTASGYNSADRWYINQSGATSTTSRQAFTVGQTDVPSNPRYYLRMNATTANNNSGIEQRVEDVDTVQGEHTLSFWVKGTAPAGGNFDVRIFQNFGSGGSTTTEANLGTFSVSGSWVKKTFTFTPTSLSGKTVGTSSYFQISIRQPDSDGTTTAWTLDIANVQLEVGDTDTDYEHRSYADELFRCKRYYQTTAQTGTEAYKRHGIGYSASTSAMYTIHYLNPPMRAVPSETSSGSFRVDGHTTRDITSVTYQHPTQECVQVDFNDSGGGMNADTNWIARANNDTSARVNFEAEL